MKLSQLFQDIQAIVNVADTEITGLCSDSRLVVKGDLFVALPGVHIDSHQFIEEAIAKGAAAILCTNNYTFDSPVPIICCSDVAKIAGMIASRFYGDPSKEMTLIGVTGTNGKTSTTHFIAQALEKANYSCGVIGTLGSGFLQNLAPSPHTTPFAVQLQQQLARLHQEGAKAVAMEVSSHALAQDRVWGTQFKIAVFTNLTRDHLDYHRTMEEYAQAKKQLFYYPNLKYAVINLDDPFGLELAKELKSKVEVYGYGLNPSDHEKMIVSNHLSLNSKGILAKIISPWGDFEIRSQLLGRFNVSNLLASFTTLGLMGIPHQDAIHYLESVHTVPGRMQVFGGGKQPLVVVDYAHTPDALQQVLLSLREHTSSQLWCVFGCGGDRDRGKRELMGQIAERYSDQLVITDDNPRSENPQLIIDEIMKGLLCPWAVEVEHDRGAAIAHVISCAKSGDVVLVAGKGHEDYQIIGEEKLPFSDADQVQIQLRNRIQHMKEYSHDDFK